MTEVELQELLIAKWGRSYDLQLRRTQGKIFLQVMWRYLEQASFPLTPEEYLEHLRTIVTYLNDWGCTEQVRSHLVHTKAKPRLGKAVNIPLDLGGRESEWLN
ncbi:DUF3067 family protein [Candidatus Synechococcus calcipolaris G9]|uniref:DUF3067 family protein n=1 Tax=Candidatus Synechococcus calcipolaris G9 TaxID=1497997 RepID=A0ABT6EZE7_9SYNE|nr:DUF3067 family protein [Candidatus Synechococcus calcipolaris]MDG2990953.1 DUF3067 family protein [Candidatus Synechococcus calcipolaris G9]